MRARSSLLIASFLLVSVPAFSGEPAKTAAAAPAAGKYTSPDLGFEVTFFKAPKVEKGSQQTEAGPVATTTLSIEDGEAYYAAVVAEYPPALTAKAVPSKMLEGARDGAVANIGGTLGDDFVVFVDAPKGVTGKFPGRAFTAKTPQNMLLQCRIFLVKNRLFQLLSVVPGTVPSEKFKSFADSFKVTAVPAP
jgi:hypothetical protein